MVEDQLVVSVMRELQAFQQMFGQGYGTMATPDGRKAHTPLAEGCSPASFDG